MLHEQYWNNRYAENNTGWDLGAAAPALVAYFESLPDKNINILIPGCGNAYEAEVLLSLGFTNIALLDISPLLVAQLRKKFNKHVGTRLHLLQDDFFNVQGQFNLIVEQTFFCALNPELRKKYVAQMHRLLKPEGILAGLLFNREFISGPPFGGNKQEYEQLFSTQFSIHELSPCLNSVAPRAGTELFFIFQKK